jgi:hypothetical protein
MFVASGTLFHPKPDVFTHSHAVPLGRTEAWNTPAFPNSRGNVYNPIARK